MSSHHHHHHHQSSGHLASDRHRSGGSGSSTLPELQFGTGGYDITNGVSQIPAEFLEVRCSRLYIEFLMVSSQEMTVEELNLAKNHAIFKADFCESYGRFNGVRIYMQPDWELASSPSENGSHSFKPGQLKLKPVSYRFVSRSTTRSIELSLTPGVTVSDLLAAIFDPGLHQFWFITRDDKYYGCRDFANQALYQMCLRGLTRPEIMLTRPVEPDLPTADAFSALGMRFTVDPLGQGSACPIDRGNFEDYERVETDFMPYDGTQAANDLANLLAP